MKEVVIEENVIETQVPRDLMDERFVIGNNECIGKLTDLLSSDQQYQVYEMTDLPLDSLEFNILNHSDVMVEVSADKYEIRKVKLEFVIQGAALLDTFSGWTLSMRFLKVENEIAPVHASQRCIYFEQIQEVGELAYNF